MKALTIEQLKSLEVDDWVWVELLDDDLVACWVSGTGRGFYCEKIEDTKNEDSLAITYDGERGWLDYSDYGTVWVAYKNKEQAECNGATYCTMCEDDIFDAYVPVSSEGDICEKPAAPGEEWVYHANYCPNCGRRLISEEAERRLAELIKE